MLSRHQHYTHAASTLWAHSLVQDKMTMKALLQNLGIDLDINTGHLNYNPSFRPIPLKFDLIFIRHGETYGNCGQGTVEGKIDQTLVEAGLKDAEKRIFQGDVDSEINQLTADGIAQAEKLADTLKIELLDKGWIPDTVLMSPLQRAQDTALPFISRNKLHSIIYNDIREMSFGHWDNKRVCDLSPKNPCHTFYQDQHALVKDGGESFCDVLLRASKVLLELNETHQKKKVMMFSHSMFGAACCILLGKGQRSEHGNYLAFDGKRKDGSYYTMPHTTPFRFDFSPDLSLYPS